MKNRNIALCIVFSLISCGIYGVYWMYQLITAMPKATGMQPTIENPVLETLLCCTVYSYFYWYKVGEHFDKTGRKGLSDGSNKILMLVFAVITCNLVNLAVVQNEINKVTT